MLKRNYESLMEASQHLKKTMTKHGESKNKSRSSEQSGIKNNAETVRSLKNMTSQALAGLVIRKNVTKKKKKPTDMSNETVGSNESQNSTTMKKEVR